MSNFNIWNIFVVLILVPWTNNLWTKIKISVTNLVIKKLLRRKIVTETQFMNHNLILKIQGLKERWKYILEAKLIYILKFKDPIKIDRGEYHK